MREGDRRVVAALIFRRTWPLASMPVVYVIITLVGGQPSPWVSALFILVSGTAGVMLGTEVMRSLLPGLAARQLIDIRESGRRR